MRALKLTLQYDGTDFVGWQRQPEGISIQGLLEDALSAFEGGPVTVHGAGRTDAGVHALAQVASVALTAAHDVAAIQRGLNVALPPTVRILAIVEMPGPFHARFDAVAKVYEYRIVNAAFVSPFLFRYAWHVPWRLDLGAMRAAADVLVGSHDFEAFQGTGANVATTRRTMHRVDWEEGEGATRPLVMRVEGDGFLRHMVRNIVGTLADVGRGRRAPEEMLRVLHSRDRAQASATAPPHGLTLARVEY